MALTLYVVRHAPTDAEGMCVGQHDVVALVPRERAATRIQEQLEGTPDVVWSSSLGRCADPAEMLARRLQVPHRVDARLLEIAYGEWQGRTWVEIAESDPERHAAFMQHWRDQSPPGGERLADLEARVDAWRRELWPGTHLLVAHAGVVRALRVLGGATWDEAMSEPVPHLGLHRML